MALLRSFVRPRFLHAAVLALGVIAAAGCSSKSSEGPAPVASADALSPIPAPEGLLADLVIATPGPTWAKVRGFAGPAGAFLPQSFGAIAATLLGVPVTMSGEFDETVPIVGAAVRKGQEPQRGVIGVHVKAGDRFIDMVSKGEAARFDAKVDPASKLTLLTAKTGSGPLAFAVLGNYLLVAKNAADLTAVGPYVVRTLATKPTPKDEVTVDVPESALAGPLLEEAKSMRAHAQGTATTLIPVMGPLDRMLAVLPDSSHARLTLNVEQTSVKARATLTPKAGNGPATKMVAELPVGDAAPLLQLPENASFGMLIRETAADKKDNANKQADALVGLLGDKVQPADKEAVGAAIRALGEAKGDWEVLGGVFAGTGPTLLLRAPVTDADAMKKALKQTTDVVALPAFADLLKVVGAKASFEKAVVENLEGDVGRIRVVRIDPTKDAGKDGKAEGGKPAPTGAAKAAPAPTGKPVASGSANAGGPPNAPPNAIDLLYLVTGDGVFAAGGFDPKDALRSLVKAKGAPNLGGNAAMAGPLAALGNDASIIVVADALRINAMTNTGAPPAPPAPLVVALGRTTQPAELWARAEVPNVVVQLLLANLARPQAQ